MKHIAKIERPAANLAALLGALAVLTIVLFTIPSQAMADYVEVWNGVIKDGGGNEYIKADATKWNEFDHIRKLKYQIHYYVDYSLLDDKDRNISVIAKLYEDDILLNDYIRPVRQPGQPVSCPPLYGLGNDTDGVHVFIGPNGCMTANDEPGWEITNTSLS